jgi:DNA-binding NtrC family response regulator
MNPTLLIVDDEKNTREGLRRAFEDDFEVYIAADLAGAKRVLEADRVDVLITDLRLGTENGMDLIDHALAMAKAPAVIMMTAYGSVDSAVEAMKRGAYDFVTKPLDIEQLEIRVKRCIAGRRLEKENVALKQQVSRKYGMENLIGQSEGMMEVFETVRQVAPARATVLIEGESGTGKELIAHAIHNLSKRNLARFVAVHCAALSPSLLESELFGHEKGAFTGATERRIGRFEQANGGTIFLDEIGEIDGSTQVKLLRVLGERSFERVGGNTTISVDVRLVAAGNKDLARLVEEGKFRDDLYHRLNVVRIHLPPLRERKDDIPLLAHAFLKQSSEVNEKPVTEFSDDALALLVDYDWPGNVRQLQAAVEHAVVMVKGTKITPRNLPEAVRESGGRSSSLPRTGSPAIVKGGLNIHDTELRLIERALEESGGNRTEAARKLGISRRTLHRRLKDLNIDDPDGETS